MGIIILLLFIIALPMIFKIGKWAFLAWCIIGISTAIIHFFQQYTFEIIVFFVLIVPVVIRLNYHKIKKFIQSENK